MSRSDYSFAVVQVFVEDLATDIIQIVDADLGNMSVTNDVENVINEVIARVPRHPSEYVWIYRDSTTNWDELIVDDVGNFVKFKALPRGRCFTEVQAAAVAQFRARHLAAQAQGFGGRA